MATLLFVFYLIFSLIVLARGLKGFVWEVGSALYLVIASFGVGMDFLPGLIVWGGIGFVIALRHVPFLQQTLSTFIFARVKKSIPKLSATEEAALNAGDTWMEESIFRGAPDWKSLSQIETQLTKEEQAFLDNETHTLCVQVWPGSCFLVVFVIF